MADEKLVVLEGESGAGSLLPYPSRAAVQMKLTDDGFVIVTITIRGEQPVTEALFAACVRTFLEGARQGGGSFTVRRDDVGASL